MEEGAGDRMNKDDIPLLLVYATAVLVLVVLFVQINIFLVR